MEILEKMSVRARVRSSRKKWSKNGAPAWGKVSKSDTWPSDSSAEVLQTPTRICYSSQKIREKIARQHGKKCQKGADRT